MLEIGTSGSVGGEGGNILSYPATVTDTAFCTVPGQHCNMTPKSVMLQCARDTRTRSV